MKITFYFTMLVTFKKELKEFAEKKAGISGKTSVFGMLKRDTQVVKNCSAIIAYFKRV